MSGHPPTLITALLLGGGLGMLYFGGLWFTIQRLIYSKQPVALMWTSFLLRLGAVLGFFHLILQRGATGQLLAPLLITFLGFLLARNVLISNLMPRQRARGMGKEEGRGERYNL